MNDLEVANRLNVVDREVDVKMVTGQSLFEAVKPSEYLALTSEQRGTLHMLVGMGNILVNGMNTKAALLAMFGAGSVTRANLAVLQRQDVSRAQELGLGIVYEGHIQGVRANG